METPPPGNNSTYALTTGRQNLAGKYISADGPHTSPSQEQ